MAIYAFYVGDPGWRKGWRDKVIRQATGYPYSHVELLIEEMLQEKNNTISASKRDGSCVRKTEIEWVPEHWIFVELEDATELHLNLEEFIGAGYDTMGAIGTILGFVRNHPSRWFCSELLAYAIGLSYPEQYTPGLLFDELIILGGKIISFE